MQSTMGEELTDVLIDLIGTEDNEDESRQENGSFSALNPGINSALVIAQSTARPDAFNRHSSSGSSENSSLRGRSGRLSYDRIREGFTRSPALQSHSDASTLSWSRSINTQADDRSFGGHAHPQEPELIRLSPPGNCSSTSQIQTLPATAGSSREVNPQSLLANPDTKEPPLSLLSPLNLNPPLSDSNFASPAEARTEVHPDGVPVEPSTLPVWHNIAGLFDLMQSQMASLSRALELARADSAALRQRCLDLEARLGIESVPHTQDGLPVSQPERPDDIRSLTPPHDLHTERSKPTNMDPALTFIRNIDELVWRRSLFAKSPVELAVLASLPDCVRNSDDILDSRNLAALEERIRLWESIVRRTQT